jgi:hypothetical protein
MGQSRRRVDRAGMPSREVGASLIATLSEWSAGSPTWPTAASRSCLGCSPPDTPGDAFDLRRHPVHRRRRSRASNYEELEAPPDEPPGPPGAPHALNAAWCEAPPAPPAPPPPAPAGGPPAGRVPLPGAWAGGVMPCFFRHSSKAVRVALEPVVEVADAPVEVVALVVVAVVVELLPQAAITTAATTARSRSSIVRPRLLSLDFIGVLSMRVISCWCSRRSRRSCWCLRRHGWQRRPSH